MKYYSIVGFIVVLALTLSDVYGRHRLEHGSKRQHQHHKHSRFVNMNHLSRLKHHRRLSHQSHLHPQAAPVATGLKCRRAKFIINQRNTNLNKEENEAAKRHIKKKHAKLLLHKFVKNNKRFRLPKETKLFEDKEGRLVTYIEDCVDSGHADKKDLFGDQTEVFIAPGVGHSKKRHHQHSSENNRGSTTGSHENAIGEEDILPASEDSLLQTVSDSNEILKDDAQKEGAAQFINDQHDTEIPSNFATVFQAATLDNPLPKKPEEGSEMQRFFNAANVETVHLPPLPESDAVTPISNQPINIPVRQHSNHLTFTSDLLNGPASQRQTEEQAAQNAGIRPSLGNQEMPGLRQQRLGAWNNMRMDQLASAFPGLQNAGITTLGNQLEGNADVTSEVLRNPGPAEYTSQLRNQAEIAHAEFAGASLGEPSHAPQFPDTSLSEPAYSFSDAFEKLKNPEALELATIVNNGPIPQTLEGAMKEDKEEASYENKFEKVFGKSNALGMQKGAAYLPQRQNN